MISNTNADELLRKSETKFVGSLRRLTQTHNKNIIADVDVYKAQLNDKDEIIKNLKDRLNNTELEKNKFKDKILTMKTHIPKEQYDDLFSK